MDQMIFTVRDSKAEAYLPPFYAAKQGLAVRMVANAVNDPDHTFFRNPEDYTLFYLGTFDEETGYIKSIPPEAICNLVQLVSNASFEITPEGKLAIDNHKED